MAVIACGFLADLLLCTTESEPIQMWCDGFTCQDKAARGAESVTRVGARGHPHAQGSCPGTVLEQLSAGPSLGCTRTSQSKAQREGSVGHVLQRLPVILVCVGAKLNKIRVFS